MFKEIRKMWFDTVTNAVTGKYSMKRLMGWECFHAALAMCFFFPERVEIVLILFSGAFGAAGLTMAGQFLNRKTTDDNGQPLAPPPPCLPTEPINETEIH